MTWLNGDENPELMKNLRFHRSVEKELTEWPLVVKSQLADLLNLLAHGHDIRLL
jgi:hypothetical protein